MITVSDDGDGIPQDILKNLFKRFQEGNFRKYGTTGHGIGLSLTQELVTLHHGKSVSKVNRGLEQPSISLCPLKKVHSMKRK